MKQPDPYIEVYSIQSEDLPPKNLTTRIQATFSSYSMVDTNLVRVFALSLAWTAWRTREKFDWFTLHWLPSLGFRVLSASARLVACALALQIRNRDQERVRTSAEEPQTVTVAVGRTTKSQRVFAKE